MTYAVIWKSGALEDLKAIDPDVATRITRKINEYLTQAPESIGKPLRGDLKGFYRLRVGDWRVVYEVKRQEVTIVVLRVGHRREIYDA